LIRFHTFRSTQWLPRAQEEVFEFFSDARNLEEITPPWLHFHILASGPVEMKRGTQIRYRLSWHGIPMKWTTQICRWDPSRAFADAQLSGPYRLWHHTHLFRPENNGTRMTDIVRYCLPCGVFGRAVDILQTRHDVEKIFEYRTQRIEATFSNG
jgi:ligand-binding SRPBCC domain-containing protein